MPPVKSPPTKKKPPKCKACLDTGLNSRGGLCRPCLETGRIRPDKNPADLALFR